jgi:hypothetical protein
VHILLLLRNPHLTKLWIVYHLYVNNLLIFVMISEPLIENIFTYFS